MSKVQTPAPGRTGATLAYEQNAFREKIVLFQPFNKNFMNIQHILRPAFSGKNILNGSGINAKMTYPIKNFQKAGSRTEDIEAQRSNLDDADAYRSFRMRGNSMDNGLKGSIADGNVIAGRKILQTSCNHLYIHCYEDFIIIGNDNIYVKRIIEHKVDQGVIVCSSLNNDKYSYPDIEINLSSVRNLYKIISVTASKNNQHGLF